MALTDEEKKARAIAAKKKHRNSPAAKEKLRRERQERHARTVDITSRIRGEANVVAFRTYYAPKVR